MRCLHVEHDYIGYRISRLFFWAPELRRTPGGGVQPTRQVILPVSYSPFPLTTGMPGIRVYALWEGVNLRSGVRNLILQ